MAMDTSPQSNTELYARKGDLISELPADVKERILELLSIRDAARTALLSTHWNHVWLRHGRLVFDADFFQCVSSKGKADKVTALVNIINNILLLHDGPIKTFALHINEMDLKPQRTFQFRVRNAQTEFHNRTSTVQENVVYNVDEPHEFITVAFSETFQEVVIGPKLNCTISFLVPIDHIYGMIPVHVLMGSDLGYGQTNWIQKNSRLCIFLSDLKFPTGQL
nr:F-box/FBD/LRR-repeat protein At1g13570-like [Ipomoea batatas]